MSIDAVVFKTFRKLGADDADAAAFAEELNEAIDKRYALHADALATKTDLAELKTDLIKAIAESQRWTITAMFAAVGIFAALTKVLN
ncbi:MAG: hypothetical protein CO105_14115 [Comamonadaceae bacterium CG_4_9_14_3_um_filter_60_33]|nr:MAG: hypothetical protein AUK51_02765 [Comamonadaceae bacterium CG2_30_59_20]PJB41241.1 MAG: hypothetical protein CO105_14115 [Comamonadaceae bacterium CG_4_9_14_3_um_filter_60_33]